jgi:hypothetical protein
MVMAVMGMLVIKCFRIKINGIELSKGKTREKPDLDFFSKDTGTQIHLSAGQQP